MLASHVIERFFSKREEQVGEVFSTSSAVDLLNDSLELVNAMKLFRKEAKLTWLSGETTLALPDDYMDEADDSIYLDGVRYFWQQYSGPNTEGIYIIPGETNISRLTAPTANEDVRFIYYAKAATVPADPGSTTILNGANIPGLQKYLLTSMLADAAEDYDNEPSVANSYRAQAQKAEVEIMKWRHTTFQTCSETRVENPQVAEYDLYLLGY